MNFNQRGFINRISSSEIFVGIQLRALVYPGLALSFKFNASIKPIPKHWTGPAQVLRFRCKTAASNGFDRENVRRKPLSHGFLDNYAHNVATQIPFAHFVLNKFNKISCLFRRKDFLKAVFEVTPWQTRIEKESSSTSCITEWNIKFVFHTHFIKKSKSLLALLTRASHFHKNVLIRNFKSVNGWNLRFEKLLASCIMEQTDILHSSECIYVWQETGVIANDQNPKHRLIRIP